MTKTISLPEQVTIGSQEYEVRLTEEFPSDEVGSCSHRERRISIASDYANARALLLRYYHECIHAAEAEYGAKLSDRDVDRIAQAVVQATVALVEAA